MISSTMKETVFNTMIKNNQLFIEGYKSNLLMSLISSSEISDKQVRIRLLDCIQVFSNFFQKTIMLRRIFTDCKRFSAIAQMHLDEEFGHDVSLLNERGFKPPIWDPILEATSSWFSWKMLTSDNTDKTVLVHHVLEASANVFFTKAHVIMRAYGETDYFKRHAEADEYHENMASELLKGLTETEYLRLIETQRQGWLMLNAACERIAALAVSCDKNANDSSLLRTFSFDTTSF